MQIHFKWNSDDFGANKMVERFYRKIFIASTISIIILFMYDVILHLVMGIFHAVFDSVEHMLDLLIEFLFDTGTHETQIIVFYILAPLICYALYKLYRWLLRWWSNFKLGLIEEKEQFLVYWREFSLLRKVKWWTFFLAGFSCVLYFGFFM
jgi:hypothetical protein